MFIVLLVPFGATLALAAACLSSSSLSQPPAGPLTGAVMFPILRRLINSLPSVM